MVHHTNRRGGARGMARRDDGLDLVMAMRPPSATLPQDGARFELHFEKARRLHGQVLQAALVHMAASEAGIEWNWAPAGLSRFERGVILLKGGMDVPAMARAMGMPRSSAFRLQQVARKRGLL
jgi:putative DNA primase/helicase